VPYSSRRTSVTVGVLAFLLLTNPGVAQETYKLPIEDLIAVQPGRVPIILSAPHGGQKDIPGAAPRKGGGTGGATKNFVLVRDVNTEELAVELAAAGWAASRTSWRPASIVASST
jgi:hypothetical protein